MTRKEDRLMRFRTADLALIGMIAGTYSLLTLLGGELSFGSVNFRFSNALIGLVPIFGWPAIFGISLGVFIGNAFGPSLGLPDILLSPIFSLLGLVAVYLLRKISVIAGLVTYSLIISLWVNFLLSLPPIGLPYFPTFWFTLAGVSLMVVGLAYFVYKGLMSSGVKRRARSVFPD